MLIHYIYNISIYICFYLLGLPYGHHFAQTSKILSSRTSKNQKTNPSKQVLPDVLSEEPGVLKQNEELSKWAECQVLSSSTTKCPQMFTKKNYYGYRDFNVCVSSNCLKFISAWYIPDWLTHRQLLSFQVALLFFSFKYFQWFNLLTFSILAKVNYFRLYPGLTFVASVSVTA